MTLQNTTYDINTGEIIVRDYTSDEIKDYENARKENAKLLEATQAEAEAKATVRQAVLDRLGLTADEAKLLLG